jgi:hypothetical protein
MTATGQSSSGQPSQHHQVEAVPVTPTVGHSRTRPSEFAVAAAELPQAILVNPYDLDGLKAAFRRTVAVDPAQQRQRMRAMRQHVLPCT